MGMTYLAGINAQANMFPGATYEKSASFLTIEMVLMAKRNLDMCKEYERAARYCF